MLTPLLEAFTREIGKEQVVGAIILCSLERPIDEAVRHSQSLGPYHRGKPGEWSYTFLIAGPYAAENTPILDCTIRDPKTGAVDWNEDLLDVLRTGIANSGGIYAGLAKDYDDPRGPPGRHQVVAVPHTGAAGRHCHGRNGDPEPGLPLRYSRPPPGASQAPDSDSGARRQTPSVLQRVLPESIPGRARPAGGLHGRGRRRGYDSRRPLVFAPG